MEKSDIEKKIADKRLSFAIRIIRLCKHLRKTQQEYVLSKQLLRSGTAIGALVREGEHAESKLDFLHKMNIALKEANETSYWLILLNKTDFLTQKEFSSIFADAESVVRLLARIVKTTKRNLGKL